MVVDGLEGKQEREIRVDDKRWREGGKVGT